MIAAMGNKLLEENDKQLMTMTPSSGLPLCLGQHPLAMRSLTLPHLLSHHWDIFKNARF